jgi:hypothetical protein
MVSIVLYIRIQTFSHLSLFFLPHEAFQYFRFEIYHGVSSLFSCSQKIYLFEKLLH